MEERLKIGELGARHGLSTATLRYYERLGLLGEPERSHSGYRLFTSDDDDRLRFIMRAKALDLSLEEIRSLLEAWEQGRCEETRVNLRHLVAHKIREARNQAREAEAFAAQLAHVYDRLGQEASALADGCGCIPELPTTSLDLDEELSLIERSVCSCGGRLGVTSECDCGCCNAATAPTAPAGASSPIHLIRSNPRGGDDMTNDTTTIVDAQTSVATCACCAPSATATDSPEPVVAASGCTCGTDGSGSGSGGCGDSCNCGT